MTLSCHIHTHTWTNIYCKRFMSLLIFNGDSNFRYFCVFLLGLEAMFDFHGNSYKFAGLFTFSWQQTKVKKEIRQWKTKWVIGFFLGKRNNQTQIFSSISGRWKFGVDFVPVLRLVLHFQSHYSCIDWINEMNKWIRWHKVSEEKHKITRQNTPFTWW